MAVEPIFHGIWVAATQQWLLNPNLQRSNTDDLCDLVCFLMTALGPPTWKIVIDDRW